MREWYVDDVNSPHYWPMKLPPRSLTARALQLLHERGWSQVRVCKVTGLSSNRVQAIYHMPARFDTVDDEVAIERALSGDATVLPALTLYERDAVRTRIIERYLVEEGWLGDLIRAWGLKNPTRFRCRVEQSAARRRKVAA